MKYKLINNTTKEETICSLVTIDGFDYYVTDKDILINDYYITSNSLEQCLSSYESYDLTNNCKKVIAANNPNIDISKVADLDSLASDSLHSFQKRLPTTYTLNPSNYYEGFKKGYNKAKETYRYTKEDLYNLAKHITHNYNINAWVNVKCGDISEQNVPTNKIVEEWVEQQLTTIYYE